MTTVPVVSPPFEAGCAITQEAVSGWDEGSSFRGRQWSAVEGCGAVQLLFTKGRGE
jgi:hypothetical protein